VLRRRLIDGEISAWDDERGAYVVTGAEGRVQPGEVICIKFLGDKEGTQGKPYADFVIVRKPAVKGAQTGDRDGDIPF
jgi:hypothetical protein